MDNVEQLGYGSLEIIQQSYASTQQHLSSRVLPLLALVPAATQWGSQNLVIHASAALKQLQDAPVLADLQDWMQWDVRCKATLGPLRDFLQEHGNPQYSRVPSQVYILSNRAAAFFIRTLCALDCSIS